MCVPSPLGSSTNRFLALTPIGPSPFCSSRPGAAAVVTRHAISAGMPISLTRCLYVSPSPSFSGTSPVNPSCIVFHSATRDGVDSTSHTRCGSALASASTVTLVIALLLL
jgi:hypothetical protein